MGRKKAADKVQGAQEQPTSLHERIEKTRTRKNKYVLDLRVNSPASMGYLGVDGIESAPAIVRLSKAKGLDVIAITDLYSGDFVDKMVKAAEGSPLTVIPGVSLRCKVGACDDVILSCLFPESTTTADINSFLSALRIPAQARGNAQYVTSQSMDDILKTLEAFSGLAIPTRMDKTPNRLSVLGELVDTYGFRTFDLAYASSESLFQKRWPKTKFNLFSFSDANALAQIGSRIARVKLAAPGFAAIKEMMGRQQVSV
jgi:PHP family Zn ribbon phosphoesterase